MKGEVRRLTFDFFSGFGALEHYLSDQSRKGLHLKQLNHFLITFERGQPQNIRYRVDVWKEPPPASGMNRSMSEDGTWRHSGRTIIFSLHAAALRSMAGPRRTWVQH